MPVKTTLSIRELTRSGKVIKDYDYIDIEDRKSHEYKGVFVSEKYADEVKAFLDKKIAILKEEKKQSILDFAGIADGDTENKSVKELKNKKAEKYR